MKGIYIHIPFCIRKCLYCDFYSVTDNFRQAGYVASLTEEIEEKKGTKADTVFIGGGTPSAVGSLLFDVIDAVNENIELEKGYEFTVEVNPNSADLEFFKELKKRGVNRVSIGVQSFSDDELKKLGRLHSAKDAKKCIEDAKKAGFDNISADLMLGIPNQSEESADFSLKTALSLGVKHISAYSLIVEENTPFYDMELNLPSEDTERNIYHNVQKVLEENGFLQYEISNFAIPGYESRHNIKYWTMQDYMGFGASAHSYENGVRYFNPPSIDDYIAKNNRHIIEEELTNEEKELERFMLGLRMTEGIEYNGEFKEKIKKLATDGLLGLTGGKIHLTKKGIDLANLVFGEFV